MQEITSTWMEYATEELLKLPDNDTCNAIRAQVFAQLALANALDSLKRAVGAAVYHYTGDGY